MSWPVKNRFARSITLNGGSTYNLTVDANASANTKGNWVELSGSLSFNTDLLQLNINSHLVDDLLIDLAIGAAGSEIAILENLLFSGAVGSNTYRSCLGINLPLSIPSGTRLSARCQGADSSQSCGINVLAFQKEFYGNHLCSCIDTIGANAADSGGTPLADCGGTADTYGAYTELSASIAKTYKGFFIAGALQNNSSTVSAAYFVDIAVGAAGSEVVILSSFRLRVPVNVAALVTRWTPIIWTPIPAGTRISARYKSSITDATDRLMDLVFYGLY